MRLRFIYSVCTSLFVAHFAFILFPIHHVPHVRVRDLASNQFGRPKHIKEDSRETETLYCLTASNGTLYSNGKDRVFTNKRIVLTDRFATSVRAFAKCLHVISPAYSRRLHTVTRVCPREDKKKTSGKSASGGR